MYARRVGNSFGLSCLKADTHLAFHKTECNGLFDIIQYSVSSFVSSLKVGRFCSRERFLRLTTQMYLIYCEKRLGDGEIAEEYEM